MQFASPVWEKICDNHVSFVNIISDVAIFPHMEGQGAGAKFSSGRPLHKLIYPFNISRLYSGVRELRKAPQTPLLYVIVL